MDFRILGPLEVRAGRRLVTLGGAKERTLLGVLLLYANEVVSSDRLIDDLWGALPPSSANKLVQTYVSNARKRFGRLAIGTRAPGYVVQVNDDELDALLFQRLLASAQAESDAERALSHLYEALALWRGDTLADLSFEGAAAAEVERLNELRLNATALRIEHELALGRHAQLVDELELMAKTHPRRERLQALLMLALYRAGRQAEALDVYKQTRHVLVDELGLEPSPALQEHERAILRHDPALELAVEPVAREREPRAPAEPKESTGGRTRLPAQPTPFVGRARELEEVKSLLARDAVRLLTLTGAGGIGKTRLAVQAATERASAHRDGVLFVALAPIRDPDLIPAAITQALRLETQPGLEPGVQLESYLAERDLLLVLDNLEQFASGAPWLGRLLAACPGLRLLAVSREPLRLSGEYEYAVPPLADTEAIRLFVERALAVRRGFIANGEVATICRRLDYIPLALELAAARVRALSTAEILGRLKKCLPLLTGGPRDAPERQHTLRATIDWSHELLDADEKRLFARLAVFTGGCTLATAEAVCDADLDTLQSLVEKNLVRHESSRYLMLETIHEYATERLELEVDHEMLRERHAQCFLELAERADPELRTAQNDRFWLATLEADRDNLRTALEWLVEQEDGENAQRLVCALFSFWHDRGPVGEACDSFERAIALPSSRSQRARTLSLGSILTGYFADFRLAGVWAEEGLSLARDCADSVSAVSALTSLGMAALMNDRRAEGLECLEEALALARETGDEWAVAVTIVTLISSRSVDDPARARALAEEASRLRNVSASTRSLIGFSRAALADRNGNFDEAADLYADSIAIAREIGFEKASTLLLDFGCLTLRRGDLAEARRRLREGLSLAIESDARGMASNGVVYMAMLAVAEGDPLRAAALAGAVLTYRQTVAEIPLTELADGTFDSYMKRAREAADDEAWAEAFATGRKMSLYAAARCALEPAAASPLSSAR